MPWLHRVRFLGMGVLGPCPERAGGCWEGAGHEGDKVRASVGLSFKYRVGGSILHYLSLLSTLMQRKKMKCKCASAVGIKYRCW